MSLFDGFVMNAMNTLVTVFVFLIGIGALALALMYFADVSQTADAIRRNYPVIGRFRALFTNLGEFFRQYFFAMDREEMPFNRAERDWVYRSSSSGDNTVAFGSTRNLSPVGTAIFVNCPYPQLDEETSETPRATPPCPCLVSGNPSRAVTADEGVPGVLIVTAVMEPP